MRFDEEFARHDQWDPPVRRNGQALPPSVGRYQALHWSARALRRGRQEEAQGAWLHRWRDG